MITKEKAKELSEILKAYSEGKTIQRKGNTGWTDLPELLGEDIKQATVKVGGEYLDLRIKPEPVLVSFTFKDRDLFKDRWVKVKNSYGGSGSLNKIVNVNNTGVIFINANGSIIKKTYEELLEQCYFEDNSSCGKYIE